jgi:UDP-xylose/UDP-N-acetylglucosamine transporter B4
MTGTFLTFAQFLYVTLQTASSQLYFPSRGGKSTWIPRIRKREVPMGRWLVQVVLFLAVSLSEYCSCGVGDGS